MIYCRFLVYCSLLRLLKFTEILIIRAVAEEGSTAIGDRATPTERPAQNFGEHVIIEIH